MEQPHTTRPEATGPLDLADPLAWQLRPAEAYRQALATGAMRPGELAIWLELRLLRRLLTLAQTNPATTPAPGKREDPQA